MAQLPLGRARRAVLAAAVICVSAPCLFTLASPALGARGFSTGLYEPDYTSRDVAIQTTAFNRSVEAGAGNSLIYVDWSGVAPTSKPLGFVPANPADPNYRWGAIDAAVRDASARGLRILLAITRAPSWAEGPGRPSTAEAPSGTWKPDPGELGAFARATALAPMRATAGAPVDRNAPIHGRYNSAPAAWPFDAPQYLLLNIAVGGNWGGQQGVDDATLPYRFRVDYVRVYQR